MIRRHRSRRTGIAAALLSLTLVAAACGGGGGETDDTEPGESTTPSTGVSGVEDEGTPVPGGEVTYGLEADTTGGFCLQEAQLAISGMQVLRAVYDTLTMPNADGEITPYLAESFEGNADFTEWTIKLREGITFHDGSDLDGDVVRDNLLAYAGKYLDDAGDKIRSPLLFSFVFGEFIDNVETVDPLTVKVTTTQPWPAFPWFLWGSSRIGIIGRAQLDDPENCNTNLVGTGPFVLEEAVANQRIVVTKNPDYWQTDENGVRLPYLDKITFIPQESGPDRLTALQAGDLDIMHTSSSNSLVELRKDKAAGDLKVIESNKFGEVSYLMLNGTIAPFDNILARQAVAYAQDRQLGNDRLSQGIATLAQGPYGPGSPGYLDDAGYPGYDPVKAKELVAQYKTETGDDLEFTYTFTSDPEGVRTAEFLQQIMKESGITVNLNPVGDQSTLINLAIGRQQQAIGWRNHPGGDPDLQFVWWHCSNTAPAPCDNLVNFGGWNDPEINALLEQGRAESDPAVRLDIYENLNREFAKKLWNLWSSYTLWAVASQPNINGVFGPPLPDGSAPADGLATGHSVIGLWKSE